MKPYTYTNKPETITKPEDLLAFLKPIPPKYWVVDTRDDGEGRCCVLGHLDRAYGYSQGRDGFKDNELAIQNNGVTGPYANRSPRKEGAGLDGASIKRRVLAFIKSRIGK